MVSTLLGIGMAIVIGIAYFLLGDLVIRSEDLADILEPFGLTVPWKLAIGILFWIFINSVLEEYVFRWFITSKLETLVGGKWRPILLSAAIFTLHHTIALAFFIDPLGMRLHHWVSSLEASSFTGLRSISKRVGRMGRSCHR